MNSMISVAAGFGATAISILLVCVLTAILNLSWREVFSHRLLDESIENFKIAWSLKFFVIVSMIYAFVVAVNMRSSHSKNLATEQEKCICNCKVCKLNDTKIKVIEKKLGIGTNELEKVSIEAK